VGVDKVTMKTNIRLWSSVACLGNFLLVGFPIYGMIISDYNSEAFAGAMFMTFLVSPFFFIGFNYLCAVITGEEYR
jgi:hypothetical protein